MIRSESITKIFPALLNAQKAMGSAKKDTENSYFRSSYADLPAVMEVSKKPLNDNGILVVQSTSVREGQTIVETILIHESGEYIGAEYPAVTPKANDPQALGSAVTYAKRYSLQSLLFIPAEDDDGEKAMARPTANSPLKKDSTSSTGRVPFKRVSNGN